ncbi:MAG: PD-(D/E)XK nuclease family transposase [Clostridiales bacterium]|jgi:predicted transposase/invertase (TIGR01784 family)|nr:PD-(D/E)XK nuclease family transposase [Clostridiales bacterium]
MPFRDGLPEILPPSEDGVFKSTFARDDAKPALLELLSDVLGRQLKDVKIRGSEPPIGGIDEKREVFDISCIAEDDKSQMGIEMQATAMEGDSRARGHRHIRNRAVLNLSDLHSGQPGRGVRYGDFYNSYQITICNYRVFSWDNELVEAFTYRNARGMQLSDITAAIFIDLTQAGKIALKPVDEMTAMEQWAVFLAKASDPRSREVINKILGRKEGISVAYQMLTSISTNEDERARFRSRRIWQQDREHEMAAAIIGEREKWVPIVAEKDAALADKDAIIADDKIALADKDAAIADKDTALADKDAAIADKDALIAKLLAQLGQSQLD